MSSTLEPMQEQYQPLATLLVDWSKEHRLPEMRPAQQTRSARTAAALIEAGRELLTRKSLEELSIEAVCAAAGTTVGAFYGRFDSKESFFVTMQRVQTMVTENAIRAFVERHPFGHSSVEALCADIVRETIANFRNNLGVMRASLEHSREGLWHVIKESGDRYRSMLIHLMSPYLSHIEPSKRNLRILFAYQALAGVIVHIVLNNPGPLPLEDSRLELELMRLVRAYLLSVES
jgi:AcrR family transcriptional regulator